MKYIHKVQYYETDKMGIAHHSNFIRWFEEARVDFLEKAGTPFEKLEEQGIFSPVLKVECQYIRSVRFGDEVEIETKLTGLGNVRFSFEYTIMCGSQLCCRGTSTHCFTSADGRVVSLKRENPKLFSRLGEAQENECVN